MDLQVSSLQCLRRLSFERAMVLSLICVLFVPMSRLKRATARPRKTRQMKYSGMNLCVCQPVECLGIYREGNQDEMRSTKVKFDVLSMYSGTNHEIVKVAMGRIFEISV